MTQNTTTKPQKTTAQKIAPLLTWAILVAIGWYWLTPNKPTPVESVAAQTSEASPPATVYTSASPQALASATQYLADLDTAMTQGLQILKANNLKDLSTHSQNFKALRETGQAQFGRSVFEPLGHCASAGIFANSWWQAEVSTVRQGGKEAVPGAIRNLLDEFRSRQTECLSSADPSTVVTENK
ncbi:hypothetical protein ICA16_21030 [Pseudomonas anatoliensis]|uniref:hypothetical protein n=1 Tax=Pseudomonas anatoliensis TaxID=2710589 RepID=UPI001B31FEB8|nr:hypothetical protein [Pseudomonas anatoliensis]MBP5958166.1 hypothetical protein [Pseudomonas anatoliensis]